MNNTSYSTGISFRIYILFMAIALFSMGVSVNAKEELPECDDGSVRMVKKVIDGKPFFALEPRLSGVSGYGIVISSHKMEVIKDKKGRTKEKLVPQSQSEFDNLLSNAKEYRSQKISLKQQAQWTGQVTFARTEHFDLEWDIPGMNIYKEGNKNQVECMLIYAERLEGMWKDAENVFGLMDNPDINGPLRPCIHDTSSNCVKTAKNLLNMKLNLGPVRGTYSYIAIWYDKKSITDDQDLWETVTHNIGGAIINQFRGLGRNQGSIPAWLDEGFAYYLTRIHRHLDKHTTKLFAESAEAGPKQIDGGTWKNVAKQMAGSYDNKAMRIVMEKALSALTQEECIMGWSIVSFLIEQNIEKYKKLFKTLDDDNSKFVTEKEFFEDKLRFDKDGNLELSAEEKAEATAVFRSYDLNGDGKIDTVKEAIAFDFRKFVEIQKQGSTKAVRDEEALQLTFGWTLGEMFDRWRAWLDGRRFESADMPDLSVNVWSKFKKNLKEALELEDPTKRARALMNLARFDSTEAAYVLYVALEEIEKLVNKDEERPLIIYQAAQKVVSLWKDKGLQAVLQMAEEGKCDTKKADNVTVIGYLLQGVAGCPALDKINVILARLTKHKEFAIRVAACDVLGARGVMKGADKHWEAVLKCINDEVRAVKIAAVQALAKLANRNDTEQFIKIVQALVDVLYNADGVIKDYLYKALWAITGEDLGPSYHAYARWLQLYKKALKEGSENPSPDMRKEGEGGHKTDEAPPTYMGEKIFAKQIIFVIDRSYSMMEPIENLSELKKEFTKGKKKKPEVTGKKPDKEDEEEEEEIDWSKIKVKWDLARETLLQTVRSLKKEHKFTVILFDHRVWIWSTKMVPATDEYKKKIEQFLVNQPAAESQGADHWGRTNIFDALAVGFALTTGEKISSRQEKKPAKTGEVNVELVEKGAELINLLTDGAPTDGKYRNTEDILMRILELNRTRKVKINTFGIGKAHNAQLLQELARQNNGAYRDLTRAGG